MSKKKLCIYVKQFTYSLLGIILGVYSISSYSGGDTRHVVEPRYPDYCVVLKASDVVNTTKLQNELNRCAKNKQAVRLSADGVHVHFNSGPITIPTYGGLLIDKGVVLAAIPDPELYDNGKHTCGTLDNSGKGCKPFITAVNTVESGIYGEGIIDGQGNAIMKGTNKTWWNLASEAQEKNKNQNVPRLIEIRDSTNFTIYKITLKNSPNFHVITNKVNGFTVWGATINTPANARNTDGIDPASSTNVTIAHTNISTGDDNIAIKAGGSGPTSHVSIINNNFGKGHGMSIGSETYSGVSDVVVTNLSLVGTTNGLRIKSDKSNGGLVNKITYTNICIKDVQNPIDLDMFYNKNAVGNHIPKFKNIVFDNVKVLTTGKFIFNGIKDNNIQVTFNNVSVKKGSTWIKNYVDQSGKIDENVTGTNCPSYIE